MNDHQENGGQEKTEPGDEVLRLAGRVCDGTITAEEVQRLDHWLAEQSELREVYLSYVRLNAELMWRYRTGDVNAGSEIAAAATRRPAAGHETDSERAFTTTVQSSTSQAGFLLRLALTTAAVFLIVLSAIWMSRLSNPAPNRALVDGRSDRSTQEPDSVRTPGSEPELSAFVATLLDATAAVWFDDDEAIDVGARVGSGELWLETGEAQLVFDSGAKVVLSGPARMTLESSLSAYLDSGELVVHMPPSAIGFRVRTATADFVDRGTEFGVVAEPDGTSEVHVFVGQVDAHELASDSVVELVDGQAMRFAEANRPGEMISYSKARFGSLALRVAAPIQWPVESGGNDHYYQLVVSENPVSWHQAAADAMTLHHRGMPGHLVTVTSREEDEFLVQNVISETSARGIWIGLTDVLRESYFRWITGEPVEFSNWATFPSQQPDNYQEAEWHGGEDYGMYTTFVDDQPWAWNDLSVDSIHEKISAYLVEFEPPVDSLRNRSMAMEPIQWPQSEGGNDHYYQLVLSLESNSWELIQERAHELSFNGTPGHLVALETAEETEFVVDNILRVCGVPENMIGLAGATDTGLRWVTGQEVGDLEISKPFLPTDKVYGLLRWDHVNARWGLQTRAAEVQPANWFGYLVEYPKPTRESLD